MTASGRGANGVGGGSSRVKVYAKSTAVSSTPVRPGKTYPLSTLDHAMGGGHVVRLVFYYRGGGGEGVSREKLKESLSEVLSYYPAMTGRMSRVEEEEEEGGRRWVVKCNDAGVRLLDAKVEGVTLEEWMESCTGSEEEELVYWEDMGDDSFLWSPYYIQVLIFISNYRERIRSYLDRIRSSSICLGCLTYRSSSP